MAVFNNQYGDFLRFDIKQYGDILRQILQRPFFPCYTKDIHLIQAFLQQARETRLRLYKSVVVNLAAPSSDNKPYLAINPLVDPYNQGFRKRTHIPTWAKTRMDKIFVKQQYISHEEALKLATDFNMDIEEADAKLDEKAIRLYFQNRRARSKRDRVSMTVPLPHPYVTLDTHRLLHPTEAAPLMAMPNLQPESSPQTSHSDLHNSSHCGTEARQQRAEYIPSIPIKVEREGSHSPQTGINKLRKPDVD